MHAQRPSTAKYMRCDIRSKQTLAHWESQSFCMFKQASKRLERRPTSIVSSALSPSTIAPNELEFCKESSVTKWHWHHCSWKDNEVDRSQRVQKHRWQPQDTWALFSLSNRATCVWASQATTALQNSASFSSQSLYSNLNGYESEIYLGINSTV